LREARREKIPIEMTYPEEVARVLRSVGFRVLETAR